MHIKPTKYKIFLGKGALPPYKPSKSNKTESTKMLK